MHISCGNRAQREETPEKRGFPYMKQMWVHASYIECLLYVPNLYSDCLILVHNLFQLWKHNILVYYECANTTYCG